MDIPREKKSDNRRWIFLGAGIAAVVIITVALTRLGPAAPSVDKDTIWSDVVKRGEMVRRVRGPGTLVSEEIRWISALTAGRVEQKLLDPGAEVDSSTVLLVMSNPDVEIQALEADRQLTAAQAQLANLETSLQNQRLAQEGVVVQTLSQYREAMRTVRNSEDLAEKGLISEIELENARD